MAAKHLFEAIINPFFISLLLLTCSAIVLFLTNAKKYVRFSILLALVGFLSLSTGFLPKWLTAQLESQYPIVNTASPDVHWIVVLGGGEANLETMPANNLLYSASIKRLLEAVRLFRQIPNAKIILSGGDYGQGKTEAENLNEVLSWLEVPAENIVLETKSVNTIGQAQQIKQWLGKEPFYLVTSATHMPRAMYLCKHQGLNPIAAPTDFTLYWDDERWTKYFIPNPNNMVYFSIAWHEILGLVWSKL